MFLFLAIEENLMTNLSRLLAFLKPYWAYLGAVLLAMIAGTLLEISPAMLTREIVDTALPANNLSLVAKLSLGFIGIAALRGLVNYIQWYVQEMVGQKVIYDIRQSVHDHLQTLPPSYFSSMGTGQIMSRLTSDVDAVQQFVGWGALLMMQIGISFAVSSAFLGYMNWKLVLVTYTTFPFLFRTVLWFDKHIKPAWENVREVMGTLTEALQENITGIRVVKAFAGEEREAEKFASKNSAHYEANMQRARVESKAQPLMDFQTGLSVIVMMGVGAHLVLKEEMTLGTLFAFYTLIWSLIWPVRMLGWLVNMAEQALAAAPRLFEILDAKPAISDIDNPVILDDVRGHVVFRDVTFAFPGDSRETLKNISLEIQPGERVAVIGGTGSGKSTLVNLLPRFLDPTTGTITLDGHDLRDIQLRSLRSHIGLVLQDNFLFSATVKDNIALGKPDASPEEIRRAAELAQASSFIEKLPKGFETPVGERGIGLSGGQKQRVALARALLMDPAILILDEATSSVDTETEYLIQEGLEEVMQGRTSIIIAKRLSTTRGADKIVIMDGGEITQVGTHEELLSSPGFYRNLFESQFAQEDVETALTLELDLSKHP